MVSHIYVSCDLCNDDNVQGFPPTLRQFVHCVTWLKDQIDYMHCLEKCTLGEKKILIRA